MAENRDLSPETLVRRAELAAALTEAGFPIATATLATMAVRGGGPPVSVLRANTDLQVGCQLGLGARPAVQAGFEYVRSFGRVTDAPFKSGEGRARGRCGARPSN
jgi:hypothetical protein